MPFSGLDYFAVDELLSDDERLVRDTFRRFVDDELMPIVGKHFRAGTFPMELPKKLGALGALGASLAMQILRFANFSHAELLTWGAYIALTFTTLATAGAPIGPFSFGWQLLAAVIIAGAAT
ncbi:MAG TPA: acyl-CoA dehydrogenase family protein, partial [Polyangia bacterium]|nr:acyl-CoA dehydrogenase family protein [Polyangia bacterium]